MFKNSKLNLIIILILALCMCSASIPASFAVTKEEKSAAQKEADAAKAATDAKRKEAKSAAKKAAAATKNFEEAEARLDALQAEIESTQSAISASKAEIEAITARIGEALEKIKAKEAEIEEQNEALGDRLTAMYKTGNASIVDVILNSESVTDLLSNIGMVHKINESDQELLKKLKNDYKKLKKLKQELEEQEKVLEERKAYLEDQQISLEAQEIETRELKKAYQAEADKWKALEDELEAEAEQLAAEAAAKQKAAEAMIVEHGGEVKVKAGKFAWPTNGNYQITSEYGWRICPFHGREFHNGLDIVLSSGTLGSPVYAIADGVITRASWYGGYGNCIQLACGGGINVLYGHLNGYNCSVDQFVKKGTVIGYIGSTGNSTGPHLHFTVFKGSNHISPHSLY